MVKGKLAGKRHRYRVLSSSGPQAGEATLLAPSVEAGGGLTCAPAPQGSLRILEGPHESPSGTLLQTIPASPQPQIPPGLRPRFCPFGGSPPVTGPGSALALGSPASGKRKKKHKPKASFPQEAMNGHGTLEVDAGLGSPKMDVGRKRKKQKQKTAIAIILVRHDFVLKQDDCGSGDRNTGSEKYLRCRICRCRGMIGQGRGGKWSGYQSTQKGFLVSE